MVTFVEWVHVFLKAIVDVKLLLDKNLTNFIRQGIQASYYTSFFSNSVQNSLYDQLPKIGNFQATLNA